MLGSLLLCIPDLFSQKTQDIWPGTIEATIVDLNAPVAGVIKSIAAQEG